MQFFLLIPKLRIRIRHMVCKTLFKLKPIDIRCGYKYIPIFHLFNIGKHPLKVNSKLKERFSNGNYVRNNLSPYKPLGLSVAERRFKVLCLSLE